jgi:hypothetical protein
MIEFLLLFLAACGAGIAADKRDEKKLSSTDSSKTEISGFDFDYINGFQTLDHWQYPTRPSKMFEFSDSGYVSGRPEKAEMRRS